VGGGAIGNYQVGFTGYLRLLVAMRADKEGGGSWAGLFPVSLSGEAKYKIFRRLF
jgi:hypothetical protein